MAQNHRITGPDVLVAVNRDLLDRLVPGVTAEAERSATLAWRDPRDRENFIAGALGWVVDRLLEYVAEPHPELVDPSQEARRAHA